MSPFSESAFQHRSQGPSFLSRLGITIVWVAAGVGLAMFMAAG